MQQMSVAMLSVVTRPAEGCVHVLKDSRIPVKCRWIKIEDGQETYLMTIF